MSDTQENGAVVALAEAVSSVIQDAEEGTFARALTVHRLFVPLVKLEEIGTETRLDVLPGVDPENRLGGGAKGVFEGTWGVHLVLMARVGAGADAETAIGELMLVRTQLVALFKKIALNVSDGDLKFQAVLDSVDVDAPYLLDRLTTQNTFVSEQILQFRVIQA